MKIKMISSSIFHGVNYDLPIETLELDKQFKRDNGAHKVNMIGRTFKNDYGLTWVLPIVKSVQQQLAVDYTLNHDYLNILGMSDFINAATKLVLGNESLAIKKSLTLGVQCCSGTGALRLGLEFLKLCGFKIVYVSEPTWENHVVIAKSLGFEIRKYRYYNKYMHDLIFDETIEDLEQAPENSIIILQPCGHNPSGIDFKIEHWHQLSALMKDKKLLPFFDVAYQGLCSGDLEFDAQPVRIFDKDEHELFIAQTFSKNMTLYGERVGNLTIVVKSVDVIPKIKSQIIGIIRASYNNPPANGARIVTTILNNKSFFIEWKENVKTMSLYLKQVRNLFYKKLNSLETNRSFDHLTRCQGLYSFIGLKRSQCLDLIQRHHIYLTLDGCINLTSLNESNIDYVVEAIFQVCKDSNLSETTINE